MRVLGHDLARDRAAALARVGAIIEEPRFHPHLTGRENLHVNAAARDRGAHGRVDARARARRPRARAPTTASAPTRSACASASASRAACSPTPSC